MDTVYPEPLSRLHRRAVRKQTNRASNSRYRTQPITFQEIKEVDEENVDERPCTEHRTSASSERELNLKFEEFWRVGRERRKHLEAPATGVAETSEAPQQEPDDTTQRAKPNPRTSI